MILENLSAKFELKNCLRWQQLPSDQGPGVVSSGRVKQAEER